MDKNTLNEARMAYESAGCALENTICEFLSSLGEKGLDLHGNNVPAVGENGYTVSITAVRHYGDALEGLTADGEWVSLSVFNKPGDYSVPGRKIQIILVYAGTHLCSTRICRSI